MTFQTVPTRLEGLIHLVPAVHADDRGFFVETYRQDEMAAVGIDELFVQDNQSRSLHGTIRGLHFQVGKGQGKLVRVASGTIVDVVVDLRRRSPTFGHHETFRLEDVRAELLWVPVGFAHGFAVLSPSADVCYKVTSYYDPAAERGIAWNDPDLGIEWAVANPIVSPRDSSLPRLREIADALPDW